MRTWIELLKDEQMVQLGGDDEPQFWYNLGSFWPILLAKTIHFYLLMHAFLSLFMLFVGRRLDTLSTWLMHYDSRFWH